MIFLPAFNKLFHKPVTVQLSFLLIIAVYVTLGAMVFTVLEGSQPTTIVDQYELTENASFCVSNVLEYHRNFIITSEQAPIDIVGCFHTTTTTNQTDDLVGPDWSFVSSLLFSFSVVTTIGYGHVAPVTFIGRIFFVFYALIGIPINLVFLANLGKFLMEGAKWLSRKIKTMLKRPAKKEPNGIPGIEQAEGEETEEKEEAISTPVLFIIAFCIYTLLGSILMPMYEQIGMFDAFYFIFVTLTTIGFGDIYPKQNRFILVSLIYISIGLALTTIVLTVLSEYLKKLHYFGRKVPDMQNVEIWFGGKRTTVGELMKTFADQRGIAVPQMNELETVVEATIDREENKDRKLTQVVVKDETTKDEKFEILMVESLIPIENESEMPQSLNSQYSVGICFESEPQLHASPRNVQPEILYCHPSDVEDEEEDDEEPSELPMTPKSSLGDSLSDEEEILKQYRGRPRRKSNQGTNISMKLSKYNKPKRDDDFMKRWAKFEVKDKLAK